MKNLVFIIFSTIVLVACANAPATPPPATPVPASTLAPAPTEAPTTAPTIPNVVATAIVTPTVSTVTTANGAVVVSGAGDITGVVNQYRALLGEPNNGGTPGTQPSGRREINWDGVPDELAAPNLYPPDFFNGTDSTRARGAVLSTPGSGLMVSARSGNPTNTLPRFGNINPTYVDRFKTFSPERLFSPIGSNIVNLEFFVPGTKTPAVVRGYGAVYTSVDKPHTAFEYFDATGNSLGKFDVPVSQNGLSFLGVVFPNAVVHKVQIAYGTTALGPNDGGDVDVAVMDDFIYGEPQAMAVTNTTATTAPAASAGFVQIGASLNRDKTQPGVDQEIAVGSLDPSKSGVAWATWAEAQGNTQQIFVSRQTGNAFEPVGASLNIHANVVAEHPSIDFAGKDRAVPWTAWYEPSPGFGGKDQVFASRFVASSGLWTPAGADRGGNEPSLNIHTNKDAQDPIVAGGTANPANPPVPWVCWQEDSAHANAVEIFVSRAVSDTTALGGFKWVPVGLNRGGTDKDPEPSLNVDFAHSDGEHCWITFAETNNTVPWVVWTERSGDKPAQVFVARAVADNTAGAGGFKWQFVPNCTGAADSANCTLNVNPTKDAADPFITAGSVTGGATVPWMVWTEVGPSGKRQVLVDRLDQVSRNKFLNVGGSLNVDQNQDAEGPSITFVGNVPYVAWSEAVGNVNRVFIRHLASDPQTGTWQLDTPKEGLAVDKTKTATYPVVEATPDGKVVFVYRQGDETKEASQIIVCTNAAVTTFLQRLPGLSMPLLQAKSCQ